MYRVQIEVHRLAGEIISRGQAPKGERERERDQASGWGSKYTNVVGWGGCLSVCLPLAGVTLGSSWSRSILGTDGPSMGLVQLLVGAARQTFVYCVVTVRSPRVCGMGRLLDWQIGRLADRRFDR